MNMRLYLKTKQNKDKKYPKQKTPHRQELDVAAHIYNPSIQRAKEGELPEFGAGKLGLNNEFQASLSYSERLCRKNCNSLFPCYLHLISKERTCSFLSFLFLFFSFLSESHNVYKAGLEFTEILLTLQGLKASTTDMFSYLYSKLGHTSLLSYNVQN